MAAVAVAVSVAYLLRFGAAAVAPADLALSIALPWAWGVVGLCRGTYDRRYFGAGPTEFRRLGQTFVWVVALTGFAAFAGGLRFDRGFVLLALPAGLALALAVRLCARHLLVRRRHAGEEMTRTIVVGRAASVPTLVDAIHRDRAAGLDVIGVCLHADEAADPALTNALAGLGLPVLGDTSHVRDVALRHHVRGVAVIAGDVSSEMIRSIAWGLEGIGAELIVSSGLTEVAGRRLHVQTVGGAPLLRVDPPRFAGLLYHAKSVLDRVIASIALLLLSPVLLGLAALVRFTSRGPALYFQERVGRNGTPFRMIKFRSMYVGADARVRELVQHSVADGPLFKIPDDPRVTRVGKWLRRFSLDELPQLFNVLGGSMSLVGPRPPLPSEVALYERDVHRRLLVKPGLTGLWQVSGRSDLSWEDSVRLDLRYVDNWSLAGDLVLLAKTARAVVKATGAY